MQQPPEVTPNSANGDRNPVGNRWLRQETTALIKIRSNMDAVFRDSNLKTPLWDDVSRKLSELGFHRSAMKCKEKFENVYKYNKRTKDGRNSKSDSKTYRFFDQLEALEANPPSNTTNNNSNQIPVSAPVPVKDTVSLVVSSFNATESHQNVSPISIAAPTLPMTSHKRTFPFLKPNTSGSTNSASSSSYSSSSYEEPSKNKRKKRRKWNDFFEKMMKEVIEKQEELQTRFLETLERRDQDRVARDEARRVQEIARMNRLAEERSIETAKNTAIVTFYEKISGKYPCTVAPPVQKPPVSPHQPVIQSVPLAQKPLLTPQQQVAVQVQVPILPPPEPLPPPTTVTTVIDNGTGGGDIGLSPTPSRWPKTEINALITLRTTLDTKYNENGPKGSLWEEISTGMSKLGYNRNAKRCKEKWENINKYYKKVKDGSKKRSESSKTCLYFDQLDAIYRQKTQITPIMARPEQQRPPLAMVLGKAEHDDLGSSVKTETQNALVTAVPVPEQQWPSQLNMTAIEDHGSDNVADYDDEDEEDGGGYEIVLSKATSMAVV